MKWEKLPISIRFPEPFWRLKTSRGIYSIFSQDEPVQYPYRLEFQRSGRYPVRYFIINAKSVDQAKRFALKHYKGEIGQQEMNYNPKRKRKRKRYRKNIEVPLRGSRRKVPETIELRNISLEEAKQLRYGDTVWILDMQAKAAQVRVGSAVKRWKRDPDRIEITFKFGLYESFRLTTSEILRQIYVEV